MLVQTAQHKGSCCLLAALNTGQLVSALVAFPSPQQDGHQQKRLPCNWAGSLHTALDRLSKTIYEEFPRYQCVSIADFQTVETGKKSAGQSSVFLAATGQENTDNALRKSTRPVLGLSSAPHHRFLLLASLWLTVSRLFPLPLNCPNFSSISRWSSPLHLQVFIWFSLYFLFSDTVGFT